MCVRSLAGNRMTADEWRHRAEREAAAILSEYPAMAGTLTYADVVALLEIAWLQGVNLGSHETLSEVERAFDSTREALA